MPEGFAQRTDLMAEAGLKSETSKWCGGGCRVGEVGVRKEGRCKAAWNLSKFLEFSSCGQIAKVANSTFKKMNPQSSKASSLKTQ